MVRARADSEYCVNTNEKLKVYMLLSYRIASSYKYSHIIFPIKSGEVSCNVLYFLVSAKCCTLYSKKSLFNTLEIAVVKYRVLLKGNYIYYFIYIFIQIFINIPGVPQKSTRV